MSANPYAAEDAEEYERLIKNGETPKKAAERLGKKPITLARYFYRHGRGDLAAPLNSVHKRSLDPKGNTKPHMWRYSEEGVRLDADGS